MCENQSPICTRFLVKADKKSVYENLSQLKIHENNDVPHVQQHKSNMYNKSFLCLSPTVLCIIR